MKLLNVGMNILLNMDKYFIGALKYIFKVFISKNIYIQIQVSYYYHFTIQFSLLMTDTSKKSNTVPNKKLDKALNSLTTEIKNQKKQFKQFINPQQQKNSSSKVQALDSKQRKKLKKKEYRQRKTMKYKQIQSLVIKFSTILTDFYYQRAYQHEKVDIIMKVIKQLPDYENFCQIIDRCVKKAQLGLKTFLDLIDLKQCSITKKYDFQCLIPIIKTFKKIHLASTEIAGIIATYIDQHHVYQQFRFHTSQQIFSYCKKMLHKRTFRYLFMFDELQIYQRLIDFFMALLDSTDPRYQKHKLLVFCGLKMIEELDLNNFQQQKDIRMLYFKKFVDSAKCPDNKVFRMKFVNQIRNKTSQAIKNLQVQQEKQYYYNDIMSSLENLNITQEKRQICAVSEEWLKKIQTKITK